ncbi:MAG TPA: hypothetical protein VIY90_14575 [Steroidobacteraceae bacterium]
MKIDSENGARQILRRVGIALITLGVLDIGVMVYCIIRRVSYSSSFNIFAVISGVYIWRGHPWYVRWVTRAAAFFCTAFAMALLVFPFLVPFDLAVLEVKLHPVEVALSSTLTVGLIVFLMWVYRELRTDNVIDAYEAKDLPRAPPKAAFLAGAGLVVVIVAAFRLIALSGVEQKAVDLAKAQSGPSYRYWVSNFSASGDHGRAVVLAYDDETVRPVHVEW